MYKRWNGKNELLYVFIFAVLVFVAGGRVETVGIDTETYHSIYNTIKSTGYLTYMEPGWNLLNIICLKLSLSYNGFLTIISALTLFPIFYLAKKESVNPFFTLFIYFSMHLYCGSFNATRQYLALSWFCLSYYYFFNSNSIKALLCTIISISIHYSCIMGIAGFFFVKLVNLNKTRILLLLLLSFFVGAFMNDSLLKDFAFLYEGYIERGAYRESISMAYIFAALVNLFVLILLFTMSKYELKEKWGKLFIFSIMVLNMTFQLQYGTRIFNLFNISQIMFFPLHIKNCKHKYKSCVKFILLLYLTFIFYRMLLGNANGIYPYMNIWVKV